MRYKTLQIFLILTLIPGIFQTSFAQYNYIQYKFLNLPENRFKHLKDSTNFNHVMNQFSNICFGKKEQINIVHLGNSHIQGGFLPNELKTNFQNYFLNDTMAHAGFIFPYEVAGTNTPSHYTSSATGTWIPCQATKDTSCSLGASGLSVSTQDTTASVSVKLKPVNPFKDPSFSSVKILCENIDSSYLIRTIPEARKMKRDSLGYLFHFANPTDSLELILTRKDPGDSSVFILHGFVPGNHSAVNYYALGVNGAKAKSYLRCDHFQEQLKYLSPDWLIISLGTNEAYNKNYPKEQFSVHLTKLIKQVRKHNPGIWILLTTPGDAMRSNQKNPNNKIAGEKIIHIAKENHCSYWNFYQLMGGEGSVERWNENDLTAGDRLHLNKQGYILKANLFFDAFLHTFLPYLNKQTLKNKSLSGVPERHICLFQRRAHAFYKTLFLGILHRCAHFLQLPP